MTTQLTHQQLLQSAPTTRHRTFNLASETIEATRRIYSVGFTELVERPDICPGSQVYITRRGDLLSAKMFARKACNPSSSYAYRNEAQMMKAIEDFFSMVVA